jgi:hypothetical protein
MPALLNGHTSKETITLPLTTGYSVPVAEASS